MKMRPTTLLFCLMLAAHPAFADCSDPAGVEGQQIYTSTYHLMEFCNGTAWLPMAAGTTAAGGPTLTCPSGMLKISGNTGSGYNDFCIDNATRGTGTYSAAIGACVAAGSRLCHSTELSLAAASSAWPAYTYFNGGWADTVVATTVYPGGTQATNETYYTCGGGSAPISGGCGWTTNPPGNSENYYCCRN